jgi:hypothetical protein
MGSSKNFWDSDFSAVFLGFWRDGPKFHLSIQKERLDKKKEKLYLWDKVMHALDDVDVENVTTGDMDEGSDDEGMEAAA